MDLAMVTEAGVKCVILLLITGVAAPAIGLVLRTMTDGWDAIGGGALAIDPDLPQGRPLELVSPVNRAVQETEARQMIEAKAYRRQRRGEAAINVESEVRRALNSIPSNPTLSEQLRAEVREMVVARNERRMGQGKAPLDIDAETERQLSGYIESGS